MEESKLIRAKELDGGRIKELEKGKEERQNWKIRMAGK